VAFLIDCTSNIDRDNFNQNVIPSLQNIVLHLDNTGRMRVAAITFAEDATVGGLSDYILFKYQLNNISIIWIGLSNYILFEYYLNNISII